MRHKLLFGLIVLGLAALLLCLFWTKNWLPAFNSPPPFDQTNQPTTSEAKPDSTQPDKSSFNFEELTIPYLRQRTYQSQLAALEPFADNANFSSYLTSYNSDGLRINALLTKPKGEMPASGWPAVIFIHGYIPPMQYRTTERYQDYVNYLARNGLVVLKIDLRGHGSSQGQAGGAYYSSDYIIDTLNARAALQASGFVNPQQIGLWGHSMAGNVVLRSLAARPEIPAAVIWAGAVYSYQDMQQYGISDNSYRPPMQQSQRSEARRRLFEEHGQFDPQQPFWQQVAATNYLKDLRGAIQLHHAANDSVVNIAYSQNLERLLTEAGVTQQFFTYQSGGHNLDGSSFTQAMQRSVEFYRQYLGK